ncbi:MAG: oligosaccharide flippase family protein [Flavobacteriales bacterium]|nr:oligosaccharide flippase family protein [Flavobacteriales bacterium]
MRRVFVTNLALVLVLNLLVKPFYILGIDAQVQVRVGTEAYGSYAALLSLSFLLNILLDFGITNWNTRHIAQNSGSDTRSGWRHSYRAGLACSVVCCCSVHRGCGYWLSGHATLNSCGTRVESGACGHNSLFPKQYRRRPAVRSG